MNQRIEKIREKMEEALSCSVHNLNHVNRVYNLCLTLAENEKVDLEALGAAALLHDIAREKESKDTDHAILGAEMAYPILKNLGFEEDRIKHIQDCITTHRYRNNNEPKTIEAKILFDADKLDALGAVGVARSFMWTGKNGAQLYKKPANLQEYIDNNLGGNERGRIQKNEEHSPQIEYETKFKNIKDKMYTKKGREVAIEKTKYMKDFLDRLEKEVQGEII